MINWRQLYNESQAIQVDETNISTERISRLVNIYKNDLVEQDLQKYAQRLTNLSRTCQICTPTSFMTYKWFDTYISGEKDIFDFRLSGRSVTPLRYYWNKNLFDLIDKRGRIIDFKRKFNERYSLTNLSYIDENILWKEQFTIPILSNLITRFQMYYTYRKAYRYSSSINVHIQPMKTFRALFQTNVSLIFIGFVNEDTTCSQLFWIFRHLITRFNWPLTTKIFSNSSFQTNSIFESFMMKSLGFIDFSQLNFNQPELFSFIYRCLKTCQQNGPLIFLFDSSSIFHPKNSDYNLVSFLCDLIRFDLSVPDQLIIPTCLYRSNLSFSQPFLLKELIESFIEKYPNKESNIGHEIINSIFLHFGYDANQLISTRINFENILAAIELTQVSSSLNIFERLTYLVQTCSFIKTDNHKWNEIVSKDIENYLSKYRIITEKINLIAIIRHEYFLDIISALAILSKIDINENFFQLSENELLDQMNYFWFIFQSKDHLYFRPCENLSQLISHCQRRNYIITDYIPQKSLAFRDVIRSDHEWSDDDGNDEIDDAFLHDDDDDESSDEIVVDNFATKISETNKLSYRINYEENTEEFKFFARLFGSYIEGMIYILKYHIDNQLTAFTTVKIDDQQKFIFPETIHLKFDDILSLVRRSYIYQTRHDSLTQDKLTCIYKNLIELFNAFV